MTCLLSKLSVRLRGHGKNAPVDVLILNRADESLLLVGEFAYEEQAVQFAVQTRDGLRAAGLNVGPGIFWDDWDQSQTAAEYGKQAEVGGEFPIARTEPLLER